MSNQNKQNKIGKYEILEKIGEGGFGLVYRGHDPLLNRQVAIKVLKSDVATAPDFVERFRREARLAASLRHANIVNVIEMGEYEGRFYLVMDLLTGGPLSELLKTRKPLLISRAIELLKPIAEALDYAHRKGMIHRDVKPSNIILNEDNQPVLTDFGLGKSLTESGGTTTGMAMGTAEYMAPEQILGQGPDARTDLYALGVITYQILTGELPFSGATPFTIQKGHAEQIPPHPRQINPSLGEQVSNVLMKSLAKEPISRYQSGAELIQALMEVSQQEELSYLEEMYNTANTLMEKRDFLAAIEKWESLQSAHPGYRDVPEKLVLSRRRADLGRLYKGLLELWEQMKKEAGLILAEDKDYPDHEGIFTILGLRPGSNDEKRSTVIDKHLSSSPSITDIQTSDKDLEEIEEIEWIKIPSGEFLFGKFNLKRTIEKPYLIGKYPVTNAQYKRFLDANPFYKIPGHWDQTTRSYPIGTEDHPVVLVSFQDAQAFCEAGNYRLPTQEEWQKAARGNNGSIYPWGGQEPDHHLCNFNFNENGTTPVGKYSPNGDSPYGCVDMAGNVDEWTSTSSIFGTKVVQGGACSALDVRSNNHNWVAPNVKDWNLGFRCARYISQ